MEGWRRPCLGPGIALGEGPAAAAVLKGGCRQRVVAGWLGSFGMGGAGARPTNGVGPLLRTVARPQLLINLATDSCLRTARRPPPCSRIDRPPESARVVAAGPHAPSCRSIAQSFFPTWHDEAVGADCGGRGWRRRPATPYSVLRPRFQPRAVRTS